MQSHDEMVGLFVVHYPRVWLVDYSSDSRKQTRPNIMRVFTLYPRQFWLHKRSVIRRHVIEAVLRHPDVTGVVSGPGWDDYNESQTIQANIDRMLPGADVCWVYKVDGNPNLKIPASIGLCDVKALRVARFHEFWWLESSKLAEQARRETANIDLVVHCHENDAPRFDKMGVPSVHIPQTCDEELFACDDPIADRPIQCLMTGTIGGEHYPFRLRLANLIKTNKIPGHIRPTPACWVDNPQKEVAAYAEHLKNARIVLCCTSKWKYALGKQIEAAMAGCVVATDMPDDTLYCNTVGKHSLRLDPEWSDLKLSQVILRCLGDSERMSRMSTGARAESKAFTNTAYAERFIDAVRSAK